MTSAGSTADEAFRRKLRGLSGSWRNSGIPSRQALESALAELNGWKAAQGIHGLWPEPPLMLTATLDDGLGQGLAMIRPVAEVAGLRVAHLGLLLTPELIIAACRGQRPMLLGLTVLQLDTEDDLARIGGHLPAGTVLVAGGPAFACDPDLARRCGVHWVARDAAHFIDLLLDGIIHA